MLRIHKSSNSTSSGGVWFAAGKFVLGERVFRLGFSLHHRLATDEPGQGDAKRHPTNCRAESF